MFRVINEIKQNYALIFVSTFLDCLFISSLHKASMCYQFIGHYNSLVRVREREKERKREREKKESII